MKNIKISNEWLRKRIESEPEVVDGNDYFSTFELIAMLDNLDDEIKD